LERYLDKKTTTKHGIRFCIPILLFILSVFTFPTTAFSQACPDLTDFYAPAEIRINLDANEETTVIDQNGNNATNGSFTGSVQEWRNTYGGGTPSLTAPSAGARPDFVTAPTGGDADNYLDADGGNDGTGDTLQFAPNLADQSFTVYFALQSFLNVNQNHAFKSFISSSTSPGAQGSWQLDMAVQGGPPDRCPQRNMFRWRTNDNGSARSLCGRPLDNEVHSFYLVYDAPSKVASFYMDGVLFDTMSINGQLDVDWIRLWRNRAGGSYQQGRIYEFGMLNVAETDFEDLAEYLNCKWGTVADDMDLEVTITPSVINPNLGDTVTYTINVLNNGPAGAQDIDIRSVVPSGLTYVPASITGGVSSNDSSPSGSGLSWRTVPLLVNESTTLTFQATVDTGTEGSLITTTAQTTGFTGLDTDTGNNSDTAQIRVQGVDLVVTKSSSTSVPGLNDPFTFTISISNQGTDAATGVVLTDVLDARFTYTANSATGGSSVNDSDPYGAGIIWNIPLINASQTITYTFEVAPNTDAIITNTASATATEPEGTTTNNTSTIPIDVGAVDLQVTMNASSNSVNVGDTITLTIDVENISSENLTAAEIRSLIPVGLNYSPGTIAGGATRNDSSPSSGTGLRWTTGALAVGASTTLTYQVTVAPIAPNISPITVSSNLFSSSPGDQNASNNTSSATITAVDFDLGITKAVDNSAPSEGQTITYTLTITNAQENIVNNILVTDALPVGVTYVAASAASSITGTAINDTDPSGAGLQFTIPQLTQASTNPDNIAVLTFDAVVDTGAAGLGTIQNTGRIISMDESDGDPSNDEASTDINPIEFDVEVGIGASNTNPQEGEEVTFTVTVTNNNASAAATNIDISSAIPSGMTYVPNSISGADSNDDTDPANLTWNVSLLPAGTSENTLIFRATVDSGAQSTFGTLDVTSTIDSLNETDSTPANDTDTVTLTIVGLDIEVTNAVSNATPAEGETVTFTITVANNSAQNATNLNIHNLVPIGLTYVPASISATHSPNDSSPAAGNGLEWTIASLVAGTNTVLSFQATVDAGTAGTPIDNVSELNSLDQTDDTPANNTDTATLTPTAFDVSVSKSANLTSPAEGEEIIYTITVTNETAAVAGTNILIGDLIPAGITYVTGSASASLPPGVTVDDATPTAGNGIEWTISNLAASATLNLVFRATVDAGAAVTHPSIQNTASYISSDQIDTLLGNNDGSATVNVQGLDVAVSKAVNESQPIEGETITYTITVNNPSAQTVNDVEVQDVLPSTLTYVAATATGPNFVLTTPGGVETLTWTIPSLPASGSTDLTFDVVVGAGTAGTTITNTATRTSMTETDTNSSNDSGSVDITVDPFDVEIVKTVDDNTAEEGQEITYTLTVSNNNASTNATNLIIRDVVPAGLSFVPGSMTGGDSRDQSTPTSAGGLRWDISTLSNGAPAVLTFRATVNTGAAISNPTIQNTATITGLDQNDNVPGNDSSQVNVNVSGLDVEVTKAVSNATPTEGDTITYTITVNNLSSQTVNNVVIGDVVPAGVTYVGASISGGTSNDDSTPTSGSGLSWTINSIAGLGSVSLAFDASVDSGASASTITNNANLISITETQANTANDTGSVDINAQSFDVSVTKAVDDPTPEEGQLITYTITVANLTSATGSNIVVRDPVPAGLTYEVGSISGGTTRSEADPTGTGLEWNIASIGPLGSTQVTFQARVINGALNTNPTIVNTASFISADQADSNSGNDSGSVQVDVVGIDLNINKTVLPVNAEEGETVTYTITVNNPGTQQATNVTIRDIVPNGISYVGGTISGGDSNNDSNPDSTGLTWSLTTLNGGQTRTLEFDAVVDGGALALSPIDNTSDIVSFDQTDDNLADNTSDASLTVQGLDLEVVKTVNETNPEEGEVITYTITVNNLSSQVINGVEITDVVPAGVTYVATSASGTPIINDANPDGAGIIWTIPGDIVNGTPVVLTFNATVDAGTAPGSITIDNTASETAMNQSDSNNLNNTSTVSIDPIGLDIEVLKAVDNSTPTEGDTVTYTITVNNTSSQSASNIQIGDVVPAGLSYVGGSISGGDSNSEATPTSGNGLTWNILSLAGGSGVSLTFEATVDSGTASTTITNNANLISLTETEDNATNNTGTVGIVPRAFDIAVVKGVDDDTAEEGQEIIFSVNVENTSTAVGTNIVVNDVIPDGLTYVAASATGPGATYNAGTRTLSWSIPTLNGGLDLDLTYRTTVDAGATTTYVTGVNTASYISSDQVDSVSGNNVSNVTITYVGLDIEVLKGVNASNPEEGDTVTYTVTVTNSSTQPATNLNITDALPVGITYVAATATGPGATYTAGTRTLTWSIPTLAGSDSSVLTFQATVDNATSGSTITNSAELTSVDQTESNASNNIGSVDINPVGLDILVNKAVDNSGPTEGDTVTYTIDVENLSSQPATNLNITDALPVGITYVAATATGPGATYTAGTRTLTWAIPTLNPGVSTSFSFEATVDSGTAGSTVTNAAELTSLDQSEDNAANNIGSVNINPVAFDIAVVKAVDVTNPEEGSEVTYTINIENTSGADGANIVINDIVPSGVTYVTGSITAPVGVVTDESNPTTTGLEWTIASLVGGADIDVSFRALVDAGTAGSTISNVASRTSSDQVDSNATNDSGSVDINPVGIDLEILKVASDASPEEGDTITYTITVTNLTTQSATNVTVSDVLPAGVTYVAASASNAGAYTAGTRTLDWSIGTVAQGSPVSLTYDVTIDTGSATLGVLSNNASISGLDQTDSNATNNNTQADIDPVGLDIQVLKAVSDTTPEEGETVVYTITVNNLSSQDATNVVIGDIVPAGVTYVGGTITGGDSNNEAAPDSSPGLTWTINTLSGAGSVVLEFDAVVDSGTSGTSILNEATLNSLNQTEDNASNNTGSVTINPIGIDLSVTKVVDEANPVEGNSVTYTITVENLSSQTATNINITDALPAGVTYVAASASGPGANYNAGTRTLTWSIPSLAGGISSVLTFQATADGGTAGTTINNTATLVSLDQSDDNATNDSGTASITPVSFDVAVVKSVDDNTAEEGQTITFTITATNTTAVVGTNILITDVIPNGLTYVSGTPSGASTLNDVDPDGAGLVWTIPTLAANGVETLIVTATVDVGAVAGVGTATNTASLTSSDQVDSNVANDSSSVGITYVGIDLAIAKSVDDANPEEGQAVIYTLNVSNLSSQTATNINVRDIVPVGVSYLGSSINGPPGVTTDETSPASTGLTWDIPSLAGGANIDLTFTAIVDASTAGSTITNTAEITALDQTDSILANNTNSTDILPVGLDLEILKSVNDVAPTEGDTITYTITVNNTSSQTATNIDITDALPVGVNYVAASATGPGATYTAGTRTLTWTIPSLSGGGNISFDFDATVDSGTAGGTVTNTASLTNLDQTEDNTANNNGSVNINPVSFDVAVSKSVDEANPAETSVITYTVNVANLSGSDGTNVLITDALPVGVTYVAASATGPGVSYDAGTRTITWLIPTLAGSGNINLTFQATVDNGTAGSTITNTASLTSSDQIDSNNGNNSGSVNIDPVGLDLEILKTSSNNSPEEGETITYTITVNNLSAQTATNVDIVDIVPNGVTYVGGSISGGDSNDDSNP